MKTTLHEKTTMQKIKRYAVLGLVALVPLAALAGGHGHKGKHGDLEGRMSHMIEQLSLSTEQQAQVHAILSQGKADAKTQHEALRELKSQIKALEPTQADYRQQVEDLLNKKHALKDQMQTQRQAKMKAVRDVLTNEQLDKMLDHKMSKKGKGMKHHKHD